MNNVYAEAEPARAEIDALTGPTVVEFGSPFCHWCTDARPLIASALARHPQVRHIKVLDGRGRRLGRSFGVKLWPTLVFLDGGREVARLVRPDDAETITEALERIVETA